MLMSKDGNTVEIADRMPVIRAFMQNGWVKAAAPAEETQPAAKATKKGRKSAKADN